MVDPSADPYSDAFGVFKRLAEHAVVPSLNPEWEPCRHVLTPHQKSWLIVEGNARWLKEVEGRKRC